MATFFLENWKDKYGGAVNAEGLLLSLASSRTPTKEKERLIELFDDWAVLTPTWFEVADYLNEIELLYEDEKFGRRHLAALLASKVAYCLGDYDGALHLALSAEFEFKLTPRPPSPEINYQDEQYVNKMIEQALDTYKKCKRNNEEINERLEKLVNRIFERNMQRKELRYVIGLALDTRRDDMISAAIKSSDDQAGLLTETVAKVLESQMDRSFKNKVLDLLLRMFSELEEPDFVSMCQCLIKLEKPKDVAEILNRLIKSGENELLLAYQIAFDLYENASQQFIIKIEDALIAEPGFPIRESIYRKGDYKSTNEMAEEVVHSPVAKLSPSVKAVESEGASNPEQGEASKAEQSDETSVKSASKNVKEASRLLDVLRGQQTIKYHMQFLIKNNHTDMLILKQMRDGVRTASAHNATVIANGLMHLGTTTDDFLRDNLDWVSKATNWNKFNAVASLGLIHKGHVANAKKVLEPYLPKSEVDQFGFKEGGSLYAYGLIHANVGNPPGVVNYLRDELLKANTSAVRHGACLGLGLAAMGTHDDGVYVQLRDCLYQDDAVAGEAAGVAMGLTMVGSLNSTAFQEMVQYVCDTQHDKIQRGLRTGIALLAYGRQEEAEIWVSQLAEQKSNAILRSTAVCTLAMAYAGSGNAHVVRRLLAKVASDPNPDVKRFAVIAIGFILSNDPEQCLSYASMLVEHFNPHVRYGAAMALGISCAGSGYKEAVALFESLILAKENFVRQGSAIALSFIIIQQTEAYSARVGEFRRILLKMFTEKGEDSLTKFGAILSQGIIDAGGRNVTISLHNRNGYPDMQSVVGMFVFLQYWYWHSFSHFLSLAFKPTCLIGLNSNLQMPKTEFRSNAKPSLFAYPAPLEEKKKEENEKIETAVLSVTNKKKISTSDKKDKKEASKAAPTITVSTAKADDAMEVDTPTANESTSDSKSQTEIKISQAQCKEGEPTTHMLKNPARVVRLQLKTLQMPEQSRYKPLKPLSQGGIIMLKDRVAGTIEEEIVEPVAAGGTRDSDTKESNEEVQPHTPFEIAIASY